MPTQPSAGPGVRAGRLPTALLLLALAATPAAAQEQQPSEPRQVPPPPPEALTQGEEIEPKVTIVERDWATIEEYSVAGQVYAVKVTPSVGPPYWIYDSDGDGSLETRREYFYDTPQPHRWKILTW